jgi:HK97 family phage portal protein
MALKSFTSKVSERMAKAFQSQYGMRDLSSSGSLSSGSMEKSMKAWIPGFRNYDQFGQQKANAEFNLSPSTLRRMYQYNCVVRMAVDTIINEVTSAKWDIMPKEKDQELDEENSQAQKKKIKEVKSFFEKPNKNRENFRTILEKLMRDMLLLDAGVLEKTRTSSGKLAEIYAIDGGTIRIDADRHGTIGGYWQILEQEGLKPQLFLPKDVIYLMMNPRTDSIYGISPLETLHNIVTAFLYGEVYNLKYFENSSTPRGMLDLGPSINEDQLDRFRSYWQAETVQQPHRTFVVGGASSGAKWTPIAVTPKDMEFNNYMKWLLQVILAVFGVTPSEVGWTEEVRGAPATGQVLQSQAFKNKAIYPMMDKISYYLTRDIVWDEFGYEDLKFEFIEEISLQEKMQKAQYDNMRVMAGIVTVDEVRKEEGLSPKPKGEESGGFGGFGGFGGEEMNEDIDFDLKTEETKNTNTVVDKAVEKAFQNLRFEIYRAMIYKNFLNKK